MMKYALIYIHEAFKKENLDATIVHTVHDEIVTEAAADQAEHVAEVVKTQMERSAKQMLKLVPVGELGIAVGDVWEH